jgi:hypothetical protein
MHPPPKKKLNEPKEFDWNKWNPFERMPEEMARRYMRKRRDPKPQLPLDEALF